MLTLPFELTTLIVAFAPLFSKPVFKHLQVLIGGAILAPGKRTVTSALRVCGLSADEHFQNYHRVLNRALWSSLAASRILLSLLVAAFAPKGVLVLGIDDTIERRRGDQIKAKGIYRDPVRSSRSQMVKASGLRWLSLMLLVDIAWAGRVWALPFLTVLCPSERYYQERGRSHQKLTERARQMLLIVKRWLPRREIIVVGDSSFAAIELLDGVREAVTLVTRLRLDAALYKPAPDRQPGLRGRPRKEGRATADTQGCARFGADRVAERPDCWLVRGSSTHGGDHVGHLRVVSHRDACGARQMGAGQRPAREIRRASLFVYERRD